MDPKLNIGIVGACGRGAAFRVACEALDSVNILAVCDINTAALPEAAQRLGAAEAYQDYQHMLARSRIDAVVIATPMHLHAPQAIEALKRNIHVLSEVTAAVSVEQCGELVRACNESGAVYMMAENYTYMKPNVLVRNLVRKGLFGEVYYAEGEYLHALKPLMERTPWRRV